MKKALILKAEYHDSVVLMRIAAEVKKMPGIVEAGLFMGTQANHAILAAAGLDTEETQGAGPDDLIISVSAEDAASAERGLETAQELLTAKKAQTASASDMRARTIDGAVKTAPQANLACFSIPGQYVAYEASKALEHNLNLFIFSDNVPIEDEVELKQKALKKGLLCMGPDCGTAYVNGYGLGFFNELPRGKVGLVASSGTGLQAVTCALAAAGQGVSQGIGVGGRDLHPAVGGIMTFAALQALDNDPATEVIVLVAKEPHPDVAPALEDVLKSLHKPVVVCCLGFEGTLGGQPVAENLDDAVAMTLKHLGVQPVEDRGKLTEERVASLLPLFGDRAVRVAGLYTGGTLAHEAQHVLEKAGLKVDYGKVGSDGHSILDIGDDGYTQGRPHPMIDPTFRNELVAQVDSRGDGIILLFDLVLGRGSHPDPALELGNALRAAQAAAESSGGKVIPVGSITGTKDDYQGFERQKRLLEDAGAVLFPTNHEAARAAALLVTSSIAKSL